MSATRRTPSPSPSPSPSRRDVSAAGRVPSTAGRVPSTGPRGSSPAGQAPSRPRPDGSAPRRTPGRTTPRAPAARRRRPQRWGGRWAALSIGAVGAVVALIVSLALVGGSSSPAASSAGSVQATGRAVPPPVAPGDVSAGVAGVGTATLASVGRPGGLAGPVAVTGHHPLLVGADGRPEILYVGADYCPFCAAERWALAVALAHFGTLQGLRVTHSSSVDVYPDTPTLSFYGSSYRSTGLDFVPVELQGNEPVGNAYPSLEHLTAAEKAVFDRYDAPPYTSDAGSIPFVDIANRYVIVGAGYDPTVLAGRTQAQIARALDDPRSSVARAVDGTANLIIAAITRATGLQPH